MALLHPVVLRRPAARLVLLLFAMCCLVVATMTEAQVDFSIRYNTAAEAVYEDSTAAVTFAGANAMCMSRGMNLFTGESVVRRLRLYTLMTDTFAAPDRKTTYALPSAVPTATNSVCTFTRTADNRVSYPEPSSYWCMFSPRYGLFTRFVSTATYGMQPGYVFGWGVWSTFTDGAAAYRNGTQGTMTWDTTAPSGNPAGMGYTALTALTAWRTAVYANIDATIPAGFYIASTNFVVGCEAQATIAFPASTFNFTQPNFILGYKELTWVQEHWWILFLIVAVIILVILFAILIFCCMTSAPPKELPPIAPMVLRERSGHAYVNASDDDVDNTPKSRSLPMAAPQPTNAGAYGAGPVMMMPMVDPEDLIQATPSIYSQEEVMQSAEGDSMASDDEESDSTRD